MSKITEYPEVISPLDTDIIYTVRDPDGTPISKKISVGNLQAALAKWIENAVGFTITGGVVTKDLIVENNSIIDQDVTADSSPTFATIKCTNLTDGYIPKHTSDAVGLENSAAFFDVGPIAVPRFNIESNLYLHQNIPGKSMEAAIVNYSTDPSDITSLQLFTNVNTGQTRLHFWNNANVITLGYYGATDEFRFGKWAFLVDNNHLVVARPTGNVGLGFTSPTCKLVIDGGVTIGQNSDAGDNNLYVVGDVSAATFTDRTPYYEGDALEELSKIKKLETNEIDHSSLPNFVKVNKTYTKSIVSVGDKIIISKEDAFEMKALDVPVKKVGKSGNMEPIIKTYFIKEYKLDGSEVVPILEPKYLTEEKQTLVLKDGVKFDSKTGEFYIQDETVETVEYQEEQRDLGAMVSILTVAIQQLIIEVDKLKLK